MIPEVYVRLGGAYPQAAWELVSRTEDQAQLAPLGGGFVVSVSAAALDTQFRRYDPARDLAPYQAIRVTGDWLPEGESLLAYSRGERWNGWATPVFEKAAADRLVELGLVVYAPGQDAYAEPADEETPAEVYAAQRITAGGVERTVYPIGTGYWCWEQID